jgi:hypothetical protein
MELSGQLHDLAALTPGKEAGWASEPDWTLWSREKSLVPVENVTPAFRPVAILAELCRLLIVYTYDSGTWFRKSLGPHWSVLQYKRRCE